MEWLALLVLPYGSTVEDLADPRWQVREAAQVRIEHGAGWRALPVLWVADGGRSAEYDWRRARALDMVDVTRRWVRRWQALDILNSDESPYTEPGCEVGERLLADPWLYDEIKWLSGQVGYPVDGGYTYYVEQKAVHKREAGDYCNVIYNLRQRWDRDAILRQLESGK